MTPRCKHFHRTCLRHFSLIVALLMSAPLSQAEEVLAAVASNFTAPMKEIARRFEDTSGHKLTVSLGSSGKLFAQIRHGAPFDVFLSADQEKPQKLIAAGAAQADSQFTYALGRLALWSAQTDVDPLQMLKAGDYRRVALANPRLAPYGEAAKRTLEHLNVANAARPKLVTGENINQTWQFVSTGNAQLGFVALSQIMPNGELSNGSAWVIPADHHQPVKQDAVLLSRSTSNPAAVALLAFLRSEEAAAIIKRYGYDMP